MPNVRGFSSDQFIVQGGFEEQILELTVKQENREEHWPKLGKSGGALS